MARSEISIIHSVLFEFTPVSIHSIQESGVVKQENEDNASYDNHWCLIMTHPQQQSLREIWPVCPLHHVHISMAYTYFSALGHIIESSGGSDILSLADDLAQGSVRIDWSHNR